MLKKREIENYLCERKVLLSYATNLGELQEGELFAEGWKARMETCIEDVENALAVVEEESPWGDNIKASDQVLTPIFRRFFERLRLPNLIDKTDFHVLARYVEADDIDQEIVEFLDQIARTADTGD